MAARTLMILTGNEIMVSVEKTAGSGTYVPYACLTDVTINNGGVTIDEVSCRAGTYKLPAGSAALPTIQAQSLWRYVAAGDAATNVTDPEIWDWVTTGATKNVKVSFGTNTGDMVLTGPATFGEQTLTGPQSGAATAGVTISFTQLPTRSAAA